MKKEKSIPIGHGFLTEMFQKMGRRFLYQEAIGL